MERFLSIFLALIFTIPTFGFTTRNPESDFDGDGKADIAVFRPSTGNWHIKKSSGGYLSVNWGKAGDVPLVGDYDGDGKSDFMIYRGGNADQAPTGIDVYWYLLKSSTYDFKETSFGRNNGFLYNKPVPADYDGDGKTDIAYYPKSDSIGEPSGFVVLQSLTGNTVAGQWGRNGDTLVSADYDGDGKADFAVFRNLSFLNPGADTSFWYILQSTTGTMRVERFGLLSDKPVPADYDGDGRADIAVYRPSSGFWYRINSSNGTFNATQFGISTDRIVPADYDGDRKADIAVYRASEGTWYLMLSRTGFAAEQFGTNEDIPLTK